MWYCSGCRKSIEAKPEDEARVDQASAPRA
eukprot:COSAG01_NODE_60362_length_295_cov_0.785714_1_plen_29_part_10